MPYLPQILAGFALLATGALAADPAAMPVASDTHNGYFVADSGEIHRLEVTPPPALRIECQKPGSLTEETVAGATLLSIKGDGIGRATVACDAAQWPQAVILRVHLRGLESLSIANEDVELKASVLSHSGHPTLLHLWQAGKEGPALAKDSPYWIDIRRLGPDGKPVAGLPPEGGWFEIGIPKAFLTNAKVLKLSWVDFYR